MTRTSRLLIWLGAGTLVIGSAPAAYAAAAGSQPHDTAACGASLQDFAGGFGDPDFPGAALYFDPEQGQVVVFYQGSAIDRGSATASADAGQITWTMLNSTYTSTQIACTDPGAPTMVTGISATSPTGFAQVSLHRV